MNLSPQQANYSEQSTELRIKRKKRWDDEGVAATVGTIMSLLVFLTFMGIFTNQFLPVWMSDNESTHMAGAIGQFTTLKSSVDISISNYADSLVAPTPVSVPITLSSAGVPVFAAPTAGIITLMPESIGAIPTFNISYVYYTSTGHIGILDRSNDGTTGGALELYCPNRYYVEQKLIYENGAVILNQTDGEVVLAGPQFSVKNTGTYDSPHIVIMMTQLAVQGIDRTMGGTGSKIVNADLLFAASAAYENSIGTQKYLNFTIISAHGVAWENWFNKTLNGTQGIAFGHDYTINHKHITFSDNLQNYYEVFVSIKNVFAFDHTHADVKLSIGDLVL